MRRPISITASVEYLFAASVTVVDAEARKRGWQIRRCAIINCPIWPYRMGKNPHNPRKEAEEAFQLSPDPLDRLTARGVQGSSLALKGQGLEASEILKEVRDEMVHGDYFYALAGVEMPYGVAQVMAGHMAAGVRWIKEANQRFSAWGNETMPVIGHMILGEIYLQMALGKEKPPFRVILRNLGFVLSSLPVASRKARCHLEEAVRLARDVDSPGYLARSLLDLGLLCQAKKYRDEALTYLEEAHQIAEPLQSPVLSQKIRRALAV